MQRLILSQIIPENYKINISVALGLIPDSSKNQCQVNFCLLLARHYIWTSKSRGRPSKEVGTFKNSNLESFFFNALSLIFLSVFETILLLSPLIERIFTAFLLQGFAMNAIKLLLFVKRTNFFLRKDTKIMHIVQRNSVSKHNSDVKVLLALV